MIDEAEPHAIDPPQHIYILSVCRGRQYYKSSQKSLLCAMKYL